MKTKRTFKAVIAMALALILSLGTLTAAFAANGNITWTVEGETATCVYHSDLELGVNNVAIEKSGYYYFDLSELENGYYSAKLTNDVFEYFCTPEKSGDRYNGWGESEYIGGGEYIIFNRKENVDIAVAGAYGASDAMTIEIEYLGEDIESLEVEEKELLLHYDIMEYESKYWVDLDTVVTFTGGKTLEADSVGYWFDADGEIKSGENTVTLDFAGYESEQVLSVAEFSDYITRIKVDAPEDATAYIYYNYWVDEGTYDIDEFTVVFTDNTEQVIKTDGPLDVTLPNGRVIELEYGKGVDISGQNAYIYFGAGGCQISVYWMNTEKASFSANLNELRVNIGWNFEFLKYSIKGLFFVIGSGDFAEVIPEIGDVMREIRYCVENTAYEINRFVSFMFN